MREKDTVLSSLKTQLYINGKWKDGEYNEGTVTNPATGEELTRVAQGGEKQTNEAIQAAKDAFVEWKETEVKDRAAWLHAVADRMEEKIEKLAMILTLEQGKPLEEAKAEIEINVSSLRWNAEQARRVLGETIPAPIGHKFEVKKQPVGVVGAITPWNFPSHMIIRKIAPAIAAGCTIVLKPAEDTPLSALAIFDIFDEVGLPKGVVNLVMGDPKEVGDALTTNNDVRKLTFTGSTEVGKLLYSQSAETVKKISLELGGHAPFIVFEDAPIEETTDALVSMKFRNNGQSCTSPNRIFVHESIQERFVEVLVSKVAQLKVGNGLENVDIGPLIHEDALEKVRAQVQDAINKGAELLTGGGRIEEGELSKGAFYAPTVLDKVTKDMAIFYEETFGPVIPLLSFKEEQEVIQLANDSDFGLAAYLFTQDLRRAEEVSHALEYGLIGLNNTGISQAETPFGGVKHSGFGRENGTYGIEEFLDVKFVHTTYFDE